MSDRNGWTFRVRDTDTHNRDVGRGDEVGDQSPAHRRDVPRLKKVSRGPSETKRSHIPGCEARERLLDERYHLHPVSSLPTHPTLLLSNGSCPVLVRPLLGVEVEVKCHKVHESDYRNLEFFFLFSCFFFSF